MKKKNLRQQKGITLIALVITIIVMLILVAVTVSIAVNGGLFNYAKKASSDYNIARIQEELQAGIYGLQMEYYIKGKSGSLRDYIFSEAPGEGQELLSTELGAENLEFDKGNNQITYKGIVFDVSEQGEVTVAVGATVITVSPFTNEFEEAHKGEERPDSFTYGDYEYKYNGSWGYNGNSNSFLWEINDSQNGWGVRAIDSTKTEYGEILETAYGYPVTNMNYTFIGCMALTTAPQIPSNVTDMSYTFYYCTALTTAPQIPSNVTDMTGTFYSCIALTTAPQISSNVTDMSWTFYSCTALTTAPEIPNNVTNMSCTFNSCTALTTAPEVPNSVTNMDGTFYYCIALKTYEGSSDTDGDFSNYAIPRNVTSMTSTFCFCNLLTAAPVIPNSVTNMTYTFVGCTSLKGTITINADPSSYSQCFENCAQDESHRITLTGSSMMLNELKVTGYNNGQYITVVPTMAFRSYGDPIATNSASGTYGKIGDRVFLVSTSTEENPATIAVKGTNTIEDNWKVFYEDEGFVYLIYGDYYPVSVQTETDITFDGGETTDAVLSPREGLTTYREFLLKYLRNNSAHTWNTSSPYGDNYGTNGTTYTSWNDLKTALNATAELTGKIITIQGSPDIELWVKSWNAKGNTALKTEKQAMGYKIGLEEGTVDNYISLKSYSGYSDKLYFPYKTAQTTAYGYWLTSPCVHHQSRLCSVDCDGCVCDSGYHDDDCCVRPVVAIKK